MNHSDSTIIFTKVDEAPALASYSLLPIIKKFTSEAGISIETRDISLAGRIIANFPEYLTKEQQKQNDLEELRQLVEKPEANIIKLPCISASIPQLNAAIKELQQKGYKIPSYSEKPRNKQEQEIKSRYDSIKGSAVNPVLRMGNSDRRVPSPVKSYVKSNPHSMGTWSSDSHSHVTHMAQGDFCNTEKSITLSEKQAGNAKILFVDNLGNQTILKEILSLTNDEIIDASIMSKKALRSFLEKELEDKNQLFSVHLKASMMKVSDPIIFGHVVSVYFKDLFEKHRHIFNQLGISPNNGLGELYEKIKTLSVDLQNEIKSDIQARYEKGPDIIMVNSSEGITNLHVPSDVIIDASMPAAIRNSGKMWGHDGELHDTKFVIPDSSYAGVYQEVIEFCKKHGAFNPATMGTVQNIGLMAQKAEEYGSHDKTFEITDNGTVYCIAESGEILLEQTVEDGDIFRMCQLKDLAVQNWVKLAANRASITGFPTIFWLDEHRSHDFEVIKKVNRYLQEYDTSGLTIKIMSPEAATRYSCQCIKAGNNTIAVTGNVLRDYLTDLFPIMEVGTSAKMLSIVPLINGGGLFETGAGGSAPKHVQQFIKENHLRWDSLGEFLALPPSLTHLGRKTNNQRAIVLAETLNQATEQYLQNNKAPSRKVNEPDNRSSHFYLTLYWSRALANQDKDNDFRNRFAKLARKLEENEHVITEDLLSIQNKTADFGGYYLPDDTLADKLMRPSQTFNKIMENTL